MTHDEILQDIEENIIYLNDEGFIKLWNKIFEEERIKEVEKGQREDLKELLLEEISYFEYERLIKIRNYLNKDM